jgi:CHAD domain-containing protein
MRRQADKAIGVYGAGVLLAHLRALQGELEGVRQARDIEYIHRMRVASRRLRSALELFGDCLPAKKTARWEPQVRAITRALGSARDTDVQIDLLVKVDAGLEDLTLHPGIRRLLLRLRQRRAKIQNQVLIALDAIEDNHTISEMEARLVPMAAMQERVYLFVPALYLRGFKAITTHLNDLLAYEPFIDQPERVEELHAMRIAAKKLRYVLETFAPLYEGEFKETLLTMRNIQDLLGEIHDSDFWTTYLPGFIEKERLLTQKYFGHTRPMKRLESGLLYFLHNRQENRSQKYEQFKTFWQELKDHNLWPELHKIIQVPFDITAARQNLAQAVVVPPVNETNIQ